MMSEGETPSNLRDWWGRFMGAEADRIGADRASGGVSRMIGPRDPVIWVLLALSALFLMLSGIAWLLLAESRGWVAAPLAICLGTVIGACVAWALWRDAKCVVPCRSR